MRTKAIIAGAAATLVVGVTAGILLVGGGDDLNLDAVDDNTEWNAPVPWPSGEGVRPITIDPAAATVKYAGASISPPVPTQASWSLEGDAESRLRLAGRTEIAEAAARFDWRFAQGNPHSILEGEFTLPTSALGDPIVGTLVLPAGEVSYVDAALDRVPFAGTAVALTGLTSSAITWRNGADALTLWQWRADEVVLRPGKGGEVEVDFHWWNPSHHPVPEECQEELADVEWRIEPRLAISFGSLPSLARGRHPDAVASAVVPIFYDPLDARDPRFRDGASVSAEDYAARVRTIAMGHSAPEDARYGNGGLTGLSVGGTVLIPSKWAGAPATQALRDELGTTAVELLLETEVSPNDCARWKDQVTEPDAVLLGQRIEFDGKFPNILGPEQRSSAPGLGSFGTVWSPTALTGRRKDVVTQALSRTYLDRLADRRGMAVLQIPIMATRNPLIAAASEALLVPERRGNWTIQEDVARALAEVELLSEAENFDFVALTRATRFLQGVRRLEIDESEPGEFLVHNPSTEAVPGFTLVVDGVVTALVDNERVEQETRPIGNGGEQTWIWWDVPPHTTQQLRIESADRSRAEPVRWKIIP